MVAVKWEYYMPDMIYQLRESEGTQPDGRLIQ